MDKSVKPLLKKEFSILKRACCTTNCSAWIADNFYLIDREYRACNGGALKSCDSLFNSIDGEINGCEALSDEGIIRAINGSGREYTYRQLGSVGSLMRASLIIGIARAHREGREDSVADLTKKLIGLGRLDFERIITECWSPEQILIRYEERYSDFDIASKNLYRCHVAKYAKSKRMSELEAATVLVRPDTPDNLKTVLPLKKTYERTAWIIIALLCSALLSAIGFFALEWLFVPMLVPVFSASCSVADFAVSSFFGRTHIPRLNLSEVPADAKTLVTLVTLISSENDIDGALTTLERSRYMNHDENVFFCLLADFPDSTHRYCITDQRLVSYAEHRIDLLNATHGNKFCMLFRERTLLESEGVFGGRERKRGAVCELMSHIVNGDSSYCYGGDFLGDIRYVLTLDSDTNLSVCGVRELVSVALHPANIPVVENGRVVSGYGIIQPSVRVSLASAYRSAFSRLVSGAGGSEIYSGASYDRSELLYGTGVFCGKGLIDVHLFNSLVPDKIPDSVVLSHDAVEGHIMRVCPVTDIVLTDSTPAKTTSFYRRQHRWCRGDFQNLVFLFGNRIGRVEKFRLAVSVFRHMVPLFAVRSLILYAFFGDGVGFAAVLFAFSYLFVPFLLDFFKSLLTRNRFVYRRFFSNVSSALLQSAARLAYGISSACREASLVISAYTLALIRLFTRKNTLKWTTSAHTEIMSGGLGVYVADGAVSAAVGLALLIFGAPALVRIVGVFWFVYPPLSLFLSRPSPGGGVAESGLGQKQKNALIGHARDMWRFYADNVSKKTAYLPPDNIQISPTDATAMRTSPTNIGFYMVSVLAAADFGFITAGEMCDRLENTLSTVETLEKYCGNLYNWYDLNDCSVIGDRFVSSVDSGNFAVMLTALAEGLEEYIDGDKRAESLAIRVKRLTDGTDLGVFYNKTRSLMSVGVRGDGTLEENCYDLLMSEARMTAYYAVASGVYPKKHWQSLGRTITHSHGYMGMLSWSGTAFEYLMPHLFLPLFCDSFMFESIEFALMCAKKEDEIWGRSESGYYAFDGELNYRYRAHGAPLLALRRIVTDEKVISPYSTYLSLVTDGASAIRNLGALKKEGMYGKYGFYEALDLSDSGYPHGRIVRSYMAHHVGMSFIAVANVCLDRIFIRRFMSDNRMGSASELLQEKIPVSAHIFENSRRRFERKMARKTPLPFSKEPENSRDAALIENNSFSLLVTREGHLELRWGDRLVTPKIDRPDSFRFAPMVMFLTDNSCYGCSEMSGGSRCDFEKGDTFVTHIASEKGFSASVRYSLSRVCDCMMISTKSDISKSYEVCLSFLPILEKESDYYAHPSFSNLFIESEYDENTGILYFHRRSSKNGKHICSLAVACRRKKDAFSFRTSREGAFASSLNRPSDYAGLDTDCKTGVCISPYCLVRTKSVEGGRASFLLTVASTKEECEKNILLCRSDRREAAVHTERFLPELCRAVTFGKKACVTQSIPDCALNDLWSAGISGDYPIVRCGVEAGSLSVAKELLTAFKALLTSGIRLELVFEISSDDQYNRPAEKGVISLCASLGLESFVAKKGGIFILRADGISDRLRNALEISSVCVYGADSEREHEPTLGQKDICAVPLPLVAIDGEEKLLKTEYGYFTTSGYTVLKAPLPKAPYSYVLAGKRFGSVVTQSSLGYTFFDNARERRLCSFFGDAYSLDSGERLFLNKDNKKYDLCACSYKAEYSDGCAIYSGSIEGIAYTVHVFVCAEYPVKLLRVFVSDADCEVAFEIAPVMGQSPFASSRIVASELSLGSSSAVIFCDPVSQTFPEGRGFVGAVGGVADARETKITCRGGDMLFFLGACTTLSGAKAVISRIDCGFWEDERKKANSFAASFAPPFEFRTRSICTDLAVNRFVPYQVAASRFFARASFYQSGGAYGFRDQLQDLFTLVYSMPERARVHIIRCCAHQYTEGGVMHWWHTKYYSHVNRGTKTKCSDDLLWLPVAVAKYLRVTDDFGLLDVAVRYISSPSLGNRSERYEQPVLSDEKESVYLHCMRALSFALKIGKNGLILMGSCDWNDGFSSVGKKGIGESVFSTMLFIYAAEQFIPIMEYNGDSESAAHYKRVCGELRASLESNAYYGDRYARAFCDDGTVLGVEDSHECKIDIITQGFASLASLDESRVSVALGTAERLLRDRRHSLLLLFTPPFKDGAASVGYIRGYAAGLRENGGQYTHGALFGVMGMLKNGMIGTALEILSGINPAYRTTDKRLTHLYKTEPYAIAADIYSGDFAGRGGWTWYTGAASWYYRIMLEEVFGIRLSENMSVIDIKPVVEYSAVLRLPKGILHIEVRSGAELMYDRHSGTLPLRVERGEHYLTVPLP